ncbi:hypothetical protein [Pseudodesulfovibrio portus]|uniref:Uncharacterized protein n=1 Tax=Pseudodesulfovibrio portus TaxID=231439 RepID=A0ABN6RVC6_9BACT|nr:hypothetical protein [Pseudodesulfovibrio portus]BDQ35040.1 hypothetical protein JCM14722_25820 [Pseudodesulfovibrio portus]
MIQDVYEDSLYGQILPAEWKDESVSSLVLLVDGEEEFFVENDEDGEVLLDYIDRWVTIEGVVTEQDDEFRIKVRNYMLEDELDYVDDDAW